MTRQNLTLRFFDRIPSQLFIAFVVALLLLLSTSAASAQNTNPTDGSTPAGLKPGAPSGSYGLSGFDNINLYNGNLNFRLPLLSIGGRGGAGYTMMLPIEQHWTMDHYGPDQDGFQSDTPNSNWWEVITPGYYPGVMQQRQVGTLPHSCNRGSYSDLVYLSSFTRLTFTAADGTEYELVDVGTSGGLHSNGCSTTQYSRGKVFVSHDGSGATFISDSNVLDPLLGDETSGPYNSWANVADNGYLFLKDGTRYRISGGYVTEIRDRNGNTITFTTNSSGDLTINDSLNRQVTVNYNYSDSSPYGLCDRITFKGFGGATRIIRVSKNSSGKPTAVWLPNDDALNRHYSFSYNSHNELSRVDLPTGGAFEYDWGPGLTGDTNADGWFYNNNNGHYEIYRRVLEKRVYPDGSTLEGKTVFTSPESCGSYSNCSAFTYSGYATVDEKDASGNLLARQRHYFNSYGAAYSIAQQTPTTLVDDMEGRETQTDSYDSNGTTLLRHVVNTGEAATVFGQGPHVIETNSTLSDTNQVRKETFAYDNYGNRTDSYEYDFGSGAAGSLVRHTQTSYLTTNSVNSAAYDTVNPSTSSPSVSSTIHMRSLPTQTSIFDSGGTERARATFEYDNYTSDSNHAGLASRSNISGLDSAYSTSLTTRGNVTATMHYLLNGSGSVTGSITAYAQYDVAGNLIEAIDARGNATNFYFDDCFGAPSGNAETSSAPTELSTPGQYSYAFATKVTNAKNQSAFVKFDYYLGRPVDGEDANGVVSTGYYDDLLDRPTKVIRDYNNLSAKNQTLFSYDDTNRIVTSTSDLTSNTDGVLISKVLNDGLGRTTESRQYEGSSHYIAVQTQYDALGHAYKGSNPFRPLTPDNETAVWTTSAFDALGRVVSVTTPDSAVVTSSYSGNTVTATDQASKSRKSVSDALGRLTTVYEDPSSLNYSTSYTYDVLNNLTQVSQGSQTRTFAYDSLKRVTSATNPESGTVTIDAYDNNGNALVTTDARSVSTHVAYDELNRPTRRWYNSSSSTSSTNNNSPSLPSGVAATDEVAFYYDSQTLPSGAPSFTRGYSTGALVATTYGGGSAGTYRGYDGLGRVVRQYQQTDSVNYLVEATYNVNGSVASETYPSVPGASDRRTVSFTPDSAGRLSSLSSSATSYAPGASVSSIGYASSNALNTETYGNSLIHGISYNNRWQPTEIKLGTSSNPTSIIDLTYSYGTTNNNGNVLSASYSGGGLSYTQDFSYDALNRLSSATETNGGTTNWSQTNAYDRYGNRQIDYGGGNYNLAFNVSHNQITSNGYSYDANGNLTNDTVHSYAFDGNDKIKSVDSTTNAYVYDGEGH